MQTVQQQVALANMQELLVKVRPLKILKKSKKKSWKLLVKARQLKRARLIVTCHDHIGLDS